MRSFGASTHSLPICAITDGQFCRLPAIPLDWTRPVLHFDETRAVEPLERTNEWEKGELPETYPCGL